MGYHNNCCKKTYSGKRKKDGNEYLKEIGRDKYSASDAYTYVKGLAYGQEYNIYDEHGNSIPCKYSSGSMPESIAANVARESGIMEGVTVNFDTYDELYRYITNPEWSAKHPNGTYIISNKKEAHASVCNGVTNSGKIMLERNDDSDARQSGKYSQKNNENDGFILMF